MKPFALERYFAEHEFSAKYLLSSSDCESLDIDSLLAMDPQARNAFERTWLGYTEAPGAPALRQRIASLYTTIAPDEVLVFSGAQEAIYAFARSFIGNNDRVVVQYPAYQSLYEVAADKGAQILRWTGVESDGWRPPLEQLQGWANGKLHAVIVNTPHNPTGAHFDAGDFAAVVRYAERAGAVLFCDEVYRLLELDAPALPAACDVSRTAVSLGVMSKSFGLAGLRIGWIATHHRGVREAMAAYKDYLTICASAPSEFLATLALDHRDHILTRNKRLASANSALFDEFAARTGFFSWQRPHAGPIGFARVPEEEPSARALCDDIVSSEGIMLLPSSVYEYGDRHVRIGYGRASFPEALQRLEAALARRYDR